MKLSWPRSSFGSRMLAISILLLLGILWGGVPSIAKFIGEQGVPPLSYSFWIVSIAASVLVIINFIRGANLPPPHIRFYFICGLTGTAIPTTIMYYALHSVPASLMALLFAITPIFTYGIALFFSVEKYHPLKSLGLIFAFVGLLLILMPDSITSMKVPVSAVLLGLTTPLFYAINIVYTAKSRPKKLHVLDLCISMLFASALVLFIVTISVEPLFPLWNSEPTIVLFTLYHGVLTATAFCLFFTLIKYAGALFSSQVTYSVTIIGIVIGTYAHNEVLPLLVWLAAGLMFAAVGFIQKARQLTGEH